MILKINDPKNIIILITSVFLFACTPSNKKSTNEPLATAIKPQQMQKPSKQLTRQLLCPAKERICNDNSIANVIFVNKTCRMACPED